MPLHSKEEEKSGNGLKRFNTSEYKIITCRLSFIATQDSNTVPLHTDCMLDVRPSFHSQQLCYADRSIKAFTINVSGSETHLLSRCCALSPSASLSPETIAAASLSSFSTWLTCPIGIFTHSSISSSSVMQQRPI